MASTLTDRLSRLVKTMRGQARITESNVQDMLREVRMALLEADVALPVVRDFIARVKEKALGQDVLGSLKPGQALVGIVNRELAATMGEGVADINLAAQPPAVGVALENYAYPHPVAFLPLVWGATWTTLAALGYFHAANRFFFMDFIRNLVRGKLASLVKGGDVVLATPDYLNRLLGGLGEQQRISDMVGIDAPPEPAAHADLMDAHLGRSALQHAGRDRRGDLGVGPANRTPLRHHRGSVAALPHRRGPARPRPGTGQPH